MVILSSPYTFIPYAAIQHLNIPPTGSKGKIGVKIIDGLSVAVNGSSKLWCKGLLFLLYLYIIYMTSSFPVFNKKPAGLDEIPPEVWKTRKFNDLLLRYCNAVYNQNNREMDKRLHPLFPQESWLRNCQEILWQLNCIKPEIEKILRKNQNGFWRNQSTTSQILKIHRIFRVCAKNLEATFFKKIFLKAFWKDGANTSRIGSPQRNCRSHNCCGLLGARKKTWKRK